MATYWLTFRLKDDATYSDRYDALHKVIDKHSTGWWIEPTSYYLFESASTIDALASATKAAINIRTDVVLIGMPDYKSARVVGTAEFRDSLMALLPFAKAA